MVAGRTQRLRHRPAIHGGHGNVEQEQIGPAVLRQRETARSVRRAEQDEAERGQHLAQQVAVGRIVIGDQNGLARAVIAVDRRIRGRDAPRIGHLRQQDLDAESAAAADGRGHPDVAAHHAGEQAADRQPQTCSGLWLRNAECAALERGEDALEIVGLDSWPGVGHLEFGDRAAVVHDELHAARLREFDRVRQQVDQDLAQPLLVGVDHDRQHRRPLEHEVDAFCRGLQAEHADQLVEKIAQPDFVA